MAEQFKFKEHHSTWLVGLVVGVTREPMLFAYGRGSSSSIPPCESPLARAGVFIVFSRIGIRSSSPILQVQKRLQMCEGKQLTIQSDD